MGIFQEYLNSKGTVETGKVDAKGGTCDPAQSPNKPPGEQSAKPYTATGGKTDSKKGFGDQGDGTLKYDPAGKNKTSTGKKAKQITAESHFAQLELVPLLRESLEQNPFFTYNIVSEMKRCGMLNILVAEVLEHRDSYRAIAEVMAHAEYGPEVCRKLVKAVQEEVDAPFRDQLVSKGDEDEEGDDEDGEDVDGDDEGDMTLDGPKPPGEPPAMQNLRKAMMRKC